MIRRIITIGNSDGVTIPVHMMRSRKLKVGDRVEILIGEPGDHVRHLELMKELEEFNQQYGQALKNLAKR